MRRVNTVNVDCFHVSVLIGLVHMLINNTILQTIGNLGILHINMNYTFHKQQVGDRPCGSTKLGHPYRWHKLIQVSIRETWAKVI